MCCNNEFVGCDLCCCATCCLLVSLDSCCICYVCTPWCCGNACSWAVNCFTRSKTRRRFNIQGGCCCDCWAAMCCPWCVVQQTLGEFYVHGYYHPTSCCGNSYPTPQVLPENMH
ncbi:hypothetical protein STCU_02931 [Strigomonas culicis]|uniref:Uncharacterized protein n=1 Tax=Strigomonas culicis TaxID=28005 RepID=S9UTI7_9TRYP|nr:hypothetical protein STCU_02931 [Strigomonas culicis]|eukprot:EPY32198.1 hypothetical protein STCU_02931 [Strigomonas culicis]